jgi:hypothetical protein
MWQDYYKCEYVISDDMLFMKNVLKDGTITFSYPVGSGNIYQALDKIEEYAQANNIPLKYFFVPLEGLKIMQEYYKERLTSTYSVDYSDYLYRIDDMINLEGNLYKNQRNRINKLIRTYGDYQYHVINKDSIPLIKDFFAMYIKEHADKGEMYEYENSKTLEVLNNYDQFDLKGGYITLNDEVIGFAIGEVVNDTMYLHIEKALARISGAYQLMNNEFLKNSKLDHVLYVNLEEDVGDMGLRIAKQSYNPYQMLDKYNVTIKY